MARSDSNRTGERGAAATVEAYDNDEGTGSTSTLQTGDVPDKIEPSYSDDHFANAYTEYRLTSDFRQNQGVVSMPMGESSSGGSATVSNVTLHQPTCRRHVLIAAERLNAWPTIPDDSAFNDDNGIGHSVLKYRPMPNAPILSADGRKSLQKVDVEIEYAMDRPPSSSELLSVGKLPYRSDGNELSLKTLNGMFRLAPGTSGTQSPL